MIWLLWLQACTFVLLCTYQALGDERGGHIDVSYLPFDDDIKELISERYLPALVILRKTGGVDETRTRGLMRDRHAF